MIFQREAVIESFRGGSLEAAAGSYPAGGREKEYPHLNRICTGA
jgi:hypothetical protein